MNFRKLITYLTMGTAAAMPLAVAQNPTILQGSYISNVFGNSNFIKNPNAQTNIADVTVSNATVTRSTTTPLVATSEFNITTSTSTGYADWSTRTFDAGMKGQNCEARFTYRGFSVGSTTAQILQGANVVAQLTLTASTDPRIASINFPCGDLSSATTFRLQQATASLTGTNEIGAIYVGLATNMANVAQAEFVGSLTWGTASDSNALSNTGFTAFGNFTTSPTVLGTLTSPSNGPQFTIPAFKPGNYRVILTGMCMVYSPSNTDATGHWRLTDGTTQYGTVFVARNLNPTPGANIGDGNSCGSFDFQYTGATTSKTFQVEGYSGGTGATMRLERSANVGFQITVYRFPSSSELVVTPERQNVFGGVRYSGSSDFAVTGAVTDAKINTTNFGSPSAFGKAQVTSLTDCGLVANDIGFCLKNVPAGTYQFTSNIQLGGGYSFGSAGATACTGSGFVSGTSLAATRVASAFTTVNISGDEEWTILPSGIVTIPSFQANLAVYLTYSKDTALGRCVFRSSTNPTYASLPSFSLQPLDQPTNSALYVQGPVKAAETGAAIPASYVGQKVTWTTPPSSVAPGTSYVDWTNANLTVQPGVWLLLANLNVQGYADVSGNDVECRAKIVNSAGTLIENQEKSFRVRGGSSAGAAQVGRSVLSFASVVNVTSSTTYKIQVRLVDNVGINNACTFDNTSTAYSEFFAIRLN